MKHRSIVSIQNPKYTPSEEIQEGEISTVMMASFFGKPGDNHD
jgi:hypothetical protein